MVEVKFLKRALQDFPNFEEAWLAYAGEIRRKGWPTNWKPHPHLTVFGILLDGELVSFICVAELKDLTGKVAGAWTHPVYRRKGLYNELIRIVINYYRSEDDMTWLFSGYHKGNLASAQMQKSQGREIYEETANHFRTRISLKKTGEEFDINSKMLEGIMEILNPGST